MDDTVSLILIEPHESNALYRDAFQSYKEVYNFSMAKGKGNLEPTFLGGNPIQLDSNNMNSLFSIDKDFKLDYNDYFISTKANGLRFMLLIGNKHGTNGSRNIYLIDSRMNFWYIKQIGKSTTEKGKVEDLTGILPPIPVDLNVDKCLIDGELLFWGLVKTRIVNKQIKEYTISKYNDNKPLIAFLAFDILYGPINPEYVKSDDDISHLTVFQLGNSGAMVGPKASGRWPTTRRRHVLEQMFLNPDSPLWNYLHVQTPYTLNTISISQKGKSLSMIEGTRYNFTILVSPFVKMREMMSKKNSNQIYDAMKKIFVNSLESQYFLVSYEDHVSQIKRRFPATPLKLNAEKGKGLSTDGLIFTPAFENYLVGSWTFCNNKQYKWKPVNELTIDFEVGNQLNSESDVAYYYEGLVRKGKNTILNYSIDTETGERINYNAIIESEQELTKSSIVECIFKKKDQKDHNQSYMIFEIVQERYDKVQPNSYLTAISVLNAGNIRNELHFLEKKYGPNPSVLDFASFLKNKKPTSEEQFKILEALSKEKLIKCCINKNPLLLFGSEQNRVLEMIKAKQKNESYELELRIDFKNPNYNYSNCLITRFIDSEYTPVPIVKIYDESNKKSSVRSVYALLGDEPAESSLLFEETIDKIPVVSVNITDTVYNYDFKIALSNEIKKPGLEIKHGSDKAGNTEYQNRYSITNVSKFWRIDIIEYGNSKDLKQAKSMWEQKPKTRIEIEYAPASYTEDILKWENEELLDAVLKQLGLISEGITREMLLSKLEIYKKNLNNFDSYEILKDLGNVLIKIFTVLDMDVGNNYGEESLKKPTETWETIPVEKIPEEKPVKTAKSTNVTKESIFSRMRKFHNFIKAELIGEVAAQISDQQSGKTPSSKTSGKPSDDEQTGKSLLDISVGKGGDLQKWENADIDIVYGIDPDLDSINEANQRFIEGVKDGRIKKSRKYTFEQKTISDPSVKINKKFDIVSCQFTLHYFFANDDLLESVIAKISNILKKKGFFIGTTLIGTKIKELIKNNQFKDKIQLEEVNINSYKMKLLDTAQIYNKDLIEYYVNFDKLKKICEKYSLELKEAKDFSEIYKIYKKDPKNKKLKDYELAVSSLNSTFIFQKLA